MHSPIPANIDTYNILIQACHQVGCHQVLAPVASGWPPGAATRCEWVATRWGAGGLRSQGKLLFSAAQTALEKLGSRTHSTHSILFKVRDRTRAPLKRWGCARTHAHARTHTYTCSLLQSEGRAGTLTRASAHFAASTFATLCAWHQVCACVCVCVFVFVLMWGGMQTIWCLCLLLLHVFIASWAPQTGQSYLLTASWVTLVQVGYH